MEKASGLRIESMERIASALERIADALEKQDAGNQMVQVDGRVFGKLVSQFSQSSDK